MATLNKFPFEARSKESIKSYCASRLTVSLIVFYLGFCGGCWSETEVPAPLPVPVADPQIVSRPVPPLEAGDFAAIRSFRFFYDVTVTDLKPGEKARIWLPVAVDGAQQRIKREQTIIPGKVTETIDASNGNHILSTEAEANDKGEIPLQVTYLVERVEALPGAGEKVSNSVTQAIMKENLVWTSQDPRLTEILKANQGVSKATDVALAEDIRHKLLTMMADPADDLARITSYVVLCRRNNIPADAEWGFTIGKEEKGRNLLPTGWAKFVTEGRWQMVDLTAASSDLQIAEHAFGTLSPDRILFSTGYHPNLQPAPAESSKVKSFVLPYIEVNGKQHEKLKANFHYEDSHDAFE